MANLNGSFLGQMMNIGVGIVKGGMNLVGQAVQSGAFSKLIEGIRNGVRSVAPLIVNGFKNGFETIKGNGNILSILNSDSIKKVADLIKSAGDTMKMVLLGNKIIRTDTPYDPNRTSLLGVFDKIQSLDIVGNIKGLIDTARSTILNSDGISRIDIPALSDFHNTITAKMNNITQLFENFRSNVETIAENGFLSFDPTGVRGKIDESLANLANKYPVLAKFLPERIRNAQEADTMGVSPASDNLEEVQDNPLLAFFGNIKERVLDGVNNVKDSFTPDDPSISDSSDDYDGSSSFASNGANPTTGNYDINHYPKAKLGDKGAEEAGMTRAVLVANYLHENGGFTKEQAAALAGVYYDENFCAPNSVCDKEYNSGSLGSGYGAGIASWTGTSYKNEKLRDAGYSTNTKIEDLTLQQQCDMIIAASQKSDKTYYNALKRCDNINDASNTAIVMTGGVGSSNNWSTHPTNADAQKIENIYVRVNANNNPSNPNYDYCVNMVERRKKYAKDIYAAMD